MLNDDCAADVDKMMAGLNIGLAVIFEILEPDEFLPGAIPADRYCPIKMGGRKIAIRKARQALQEGGIEGFERSVRENLGDETADKVFFKK